jgi:radical SAM protein with 4Fe4S-binding SPASM domain
VPSVSFTGGEPTVRDDLPDLVADATATGLRVNLISNGVLIDDTLAGRLATAGLRSAQISIEGATAATHDALTGMPGSFAESLAGIEALRRQKIPVHGNTTLNAANLAEATALPALAKSLGLERLSMNLIIPSAWLKGHHADLLVHYRDIGPLVLAIREAARREGIAFFWYSPTPYCLFNPIAHQLGNKGCAACDGLLSIDPQGQVIPCSSFFEPQGSLLQEPFLTIWNRRGTCAIRNKERAPARCHDCDLFQLCEGACPLYWNIMGEEELPRLVPPPTCPSADASRREQETIACLP